MTAKGNLVITKIPSTYYFWGSPRSGAAWDGTYAFVGTENAIISMMNYFLPLEVQ